jgi:hypothetical protein
LAHCIAILIIKRVVKKWDRMAGTRFM